MPKTSTSRMDAVRRYEILDAPRDSSFDRIAALAATIFAVPIGSVTIVDESRVWFLALAGADGVTEVGIEPGLCASAARQDDTYVVTDALADPRTLEHPLVRGELGLRFYAAAPIISADGHRLGTVNVIGKEPREVAEGELAMLRDLAAIVMEQLELRLAALRAVRAERHQRIQAEHERDVATRLARSVQSAAAAAKAKRARSVRGVRERRRPVRAPCRASDRGLLGGCGLDLCGPRRGGAGQRARRLPSLT